MIEGKTKRIEDLDDPNLVRIVTKDSLTANDAAIQADLPVAKDKTTQNCSVMHYLKNNGVPVAYEIRNDETSFVSKKCEMIPIECVMRRRPYGSYLKRVPEKSSAEIFSNSWSTNVPALFIKVSKFPNNSKDLLTKYSAPCTVDKSDFT